MSVLFINKPCQDKLKLEESSGYYQVIRLLRTSPRVWTIRSRFLTHCSVKLHPYVLFHFFTLRFVLYVFTCCVLKSDKSTPFCNWAIFSIISGKFLNRPWQLGCFIYQTVAADIQSPAGVRRWSWPISQPFNRSVVGPQSDTCPAAVSNFTSQMDGITSANKLLYLMRSDYWEAWTS